jgi:RNA polymerase sigma-70 factor (ECF subfamily)
MADAIGLALLVVLETLAPAERLAFVLHDLFAPPIVGRTLTATRELASRARDTCRGELRRPRLSPTRQREYIALTRPNGSPRSLGERGARPYPIAQS